MQRVLILSLVCLLPSTSYAVSLTSYYKLDETSGTSAADATGNHVAGTYQNLVGGLGASASPGDPGGNSVEFLAGSSSRRVAIPTAGGLGDGSNFSITAWVQFNDNTQDHTIVGGPGGFSAGNTLLFWRDEASSGGGSTATNTISGLVSGDPRAVGAAGALNDSNWHLVALTFDNSDAGITDSEKIYVDGTRTMSGTGSNEPGVLSLASTLNLGNVGDDQANQLEGFIDEVAFWSRELLPGEMDALYFFSGAEEEFFTDAQGAATLFDFFENGTTGDVLVFNQPLGFQIVDDVTAFGGTADQSALVDGQFVLGLNGSAGLVSFITPEPTSIALWTLLGLTVLGCAGRRLY